MFHHVCSVKGLFFASFLVFCLFSMSYLYLPPSVLFPVSLALPVFIYLWYAEVVGIDHGWVMTPRRSVNASHSINSTIDRAMYMCSFHVPLLWEKSRGKACVLRFFVFFKCAALLSEAVLRGQTHFPPCFFSSSLVLIIIWTVYTCHSPCLLLSLLLFSPVSLILVLLTPVVISFVCFFCLFVFVFLLSFSRFPFASVPVMFLL